MKNLFCAAALISLAGCASVDRSTHDVVSSRVFAPYQRPAETRGDNTSATLTLVRDNGLHGGGCSSRVSIDGRLAVQIEQGEHVTLPVSGGQHSLTLSHFGACSPDEQTLQTPAGQAASYRIDADGESAAAAKNA